MTTKIRPVATAIAAVACWLDLSRPGRAQDPNQAPPAVALSASRVPTKFGPLEVMKQSLNLTDEQVSKLEPVMKAQQAKVAALRSDTSLTRQEKLAKLKQIGEEGNARFSAVLTTNQIGQWHAMRTNSMQHLRQPHEYQRATPEAAPQSEGPGQKQGSSSTTNAPPATPKRTASPNRAPAIQSNGVGHSQ